MVDGDTIVVEIDGCDYRVRYIGIDTPEALHPSRSVERMGARGECREQGTGGGKAVYLGKGISEVDKYDRLLRYMLLADGTFVNAELVHQGYAQASTHPLDARYVEFCLGLQREACEAECGLWGSTPVPVAQPEKLGECTGGVTCARQGPSV